MLGLATLFSSILLGSMVFFAAIVAPTIFKTLEDDEALKFARKLFPKYYLWGIVISSLALISSVIARSYIFILLIIILLGFLYGRQILQPKVAKAKDQWLASDTAQDKARYKSLHKRSVIINASQIVMLLIIVVATQVLR